MRTLIPSLILTLTLGAAEPSPAGTQSLTEDERQAIADTIRALLAETARAYASPDCEGVEDVSVLREGYVLAERGGIHRFETKDQLVALCHAIKEDRLSEEEEIQEQTVEVLSEDVAYSVTRSVQTTRWRDGRTEVKPTVETVIFVRDADGWGMVHQHLSWSEAEQPSSAQADPAP